jgi:catechol 2,3-dioxygenase-like lactoylglutathione lyase family enzyme
MGLPNGVHHLAFSTGDIKAQIAFFTEVLGAELKALYWMHGADDTMHAFLRLDDDSYVAFVHNKAIAAIDPVPGVTHADSYTAASAPGTMQHVALNVGTERELLDLRDRIRDRGHNVFGPLDHGFCKSIYFAGPEGLLLEAAWSPAAIDERSWIDPEVAALVGIDADDLARYVAPSPHAGRGGAVAQPPIDPTKPAMRIPAERYAWLMGSPDEVVIEALSEPDPPVVPAS